MTTTTGGPLPVVPSNVTATPGNRNVRLGWNMTGIDYNQYQIFAFENSVNIGTVNVTGRVFTWSNLVNGRSYVFKVVACTSGVPQNCNRASANAATVGCGTTDCSNAAVPTTPSQAYDTCFALNGDCTQCLSVATRLCGMCVSNSSRLGCFPNTLLQTHHRDACVSDGGIWQEATRTPAPVCNSIRPGVCVCVCVCVCVREGGKEGKEGKKEERSEGGGK
jgi:hypothetical protein